MAKTRSFHELILVLGLLSMSDAKRYSDSKRVLPSISTSQLDLQANEESLAAEKKAEEETQAQKTTSSFSDGKNSSMVELGYEPTLEEMRLYYELCRQLRSRQGQIWDGWIHGGGQQYILKISQEFKDFYPGGWPADPGEKYFRDSVELRAQVKKIADELVEIRKIESKIFARQKYDTSESYTMEQLTKLYGNELDSWTLKNQRKDGLSVYSILLSDLATAFMKHMGDDMSGMDILTRQIFSLYDGNYVRYRDRFYSFFNMLTFDAPPPFAKGKLYHTPEGKSRRKLEGNFYSKITSVTLEDTTTNPKFLTKPKETSWEWVFFIKKGWDWSGSWAKIPEDKELRFPLLPSKAYKWPGDRSEGAVSWNTNHTPWTFEFENPRGDGAARIRESLTDEETNRGEHMIKKYGAWKMKKYVFKRMEDEYIKKDMRMVKRIVDAIKPGNEHKYVMMRLNMVKDLFEMMIQNRAYGGKRPFQYVTGEIFYKLVSEWPLAHKSYHYDH